MFEVIYFYPGNYLMLEIGNTEGTGSNNSNIIIVCEANFNEEIVIKKWAK